MTPPTRAASRRNISLPVIDARVQRADERLSRRRRMRAAALIGVWVLMIAHVSHWAISGRSVAPFVLSDAMKTLELGQINPGFLLLAAALLVTLLCGRFLCGWACHMGALQDGCAWVLKKCGVRPRMFRSRLLGYVPLGLALYMFVWPTFKREALAPLLARFWPAAVAWLGPVQPFPGWSTRFMTTDLWDGLPSVAIAIPFLLLCGFGTVYFLGARGLCRYGCPYGGFFLPAEQLAVGRVVVNPDLCDSCGRCTAACSAGVRVLEETKAFGMVVDRNCMRSLDCVAACPHDALSFGLARPALLRQGVATPSAGGGYQLSLRAELAVASVFAVSLVVFRGLYGLIPLLMAVTMAVLTGFVLWRAARLFAERDARFAGVQLRRSGRFQIGGRVFLALAVGMLGLLLHSATVRTLQWRAGLIDGRVQTTREHAFGLDPTGVSDVDRATARDALWWYGIASGLGSGGIGLIDTPELELREAWLWLVAGEPARAEEQIRGLMNDHPQSDRLTAELARVLVLQGRSGDAVKELWAGCRARPGSNESRELLVGMLADLGQWSDAEAAAREGAEADGADGVARVLLARVLLACGKAGDAAVELEATEASAEVLDLLATARAMKGDLAGTLDALKRLWRMDENARTYVDRRASEALAASGETDPVTAWRSFLSESSK